MSDYICSKCYKRFSSANCKIEDGDVVCWDCSCTTIMSEPKPKPRTVETIMQDIEDKRLVLSIKYKQLDQSLAIDALWPGVFSLGGKVTSCWVGNVYGPMTFSIRMTRADGSFVFHDYDESVIPPALLATLPTEAVLYRAECERKREMLMRVRG